MKKGPELTAEQTALVFRTVAQIIDNNKALLKTEGVFRISADAKNPPEIIKKILKKKNITNDKYTIHDLIGALKQALKDNILIDAEDPRIKELQKVMKAVDSSDPKSIHKGVEAINQLIDKLLKAKDKSSKAIAEILHTYLHLAQIAALSADSNKMSPNNLAIGAIAPIFYNNIQLATAPLEVMDLIGVANAVCADIIKPNNNPYRESFSERGEHFSKKRALHHIIDQLETNLLTLKERLANNSISQNAFDAMASNIKVDIDKRKTQLADMSVSAQRQDTPIASHRAKSIRHSIAPATLLSDSRKRIENPNDTEKNEKLKKSKDRPA